MIIVEVNGVKHNVPNKYSEISVSEFIGYWKILCKYDLQQEEDIIKRDSDEMDCTFEIVAKLLNMSVEDAKFIDYQQGKEVINCFNSMLNQDNLDQDYSGWTFIHEDEAYWFPKLELNNMTFGEYAEVKQLEAMLGQEIENRFDFIPEQMSILCRKKDEKKGTYNREERVELFKSINMDVVMRFAFFLSKWNRLLSQSSQISTDNQKELEKKLVIS